MKTLLTLAVMLVSVSVFGQSFRDWTIATNSVRGALTNSLAYTNVATANSTYDLDTMRATKVLVELSAKTTSATNDTVFTGRFQYSFDGTNFYSLAALVLPLTLNYSNTVTVHTNFDTSFFRYLRVASLENISVNHTTNAVTNIVLRTFFK